MNRQVYLQRPDLFQSSLSNLRASSIGTTLLQRGYEVERAAIYQPNIAILVRTKNDALGIKRIFEHIEHERKSYEGRIDVLVVDTESTDETLALAKKFRAVVVPIKQAEFSYPKAINMGLNSVKKDVVATFITIGHAQPALSNCLKAGARHFKDIRVAGVYGQVLPHENATFWEKGFYYKSGRLKLPAQKIQQAEMGVMGATNCMIRMTTWRQHAFDEAYAKGGEDQAWARWVLKNKYEIIFEPALAVHHTHGLGPINLIRQYRHWREVSNPLPFDQIEIIRRRPDLFK